ncbi:MAG: ABC transporter permease [Bryobacteraceae bacterium]
MFVDLLYRFRALIRRHSVEAELDEELRDHLEREAEKLRKNGLPAEEAMRRARIALGGPEQVKEDCRNARGTWWLETLRQDVRYTFRTLRQSPAFAATAILSLALGIGANTAIFSVLNAVMLKMLPVRDPQRLVELTQGEEDDFFTYPLWEQIRDREDVFSGVFTYGGGSFDLASGGEKHPVEGLYVSGDYFRTLGVRAILGRIILLADDRRGGGSAGPVAVLSYGFWQREYGGDRKILGRTIRLDGHLFQVVGVTPPEFFGVDVGASFDVAIPVTSVAILRPENPRMLNGRSHWWLNIIGRLKDNISPKQAAARLKVLAPAIYRAAAPSDLKPEFQRDFLEKTLDLKPAATGLSDLRDRYGRGLDLLMGMVGVVLLIACANVANLVLARANARQREIAVRMAIGAGRLRLVRQLLTESMLISFCGAATGIILAYWGSRLLVDLISSAREPRFLNLTPDVRVLLFTIFVATLTGVLFGLAPALEATRLSPSIALKEGARVHTHRRGRWSLGRMLVAAQVALSLVLLVGAGLFVRSLRKLLTQDMGFERNGVLLVDPDLRGGRFSPERQPVIAGELLERLRSIPGVESAARSAETPIGSGDWEWHVRVDAPGGSQKSVHCFFNLVSPGYFQTLGTPLLAGRDFTIRDAKTSPLVAIVNETAARILFPGTNPLGRVYHDERPLGQRGAKQVLVEVVGLAKDAKYRKLRDAPPPTIYIPIAQLPVPFPVIGTYELKFAGPPSRVIANVKKVVQTFNPRLSIDFHLLSTQVADSLLQERLLATLATVFGLLALTLASIGIYGVIAYSVARRRNEIGIRMALGAGRGSVLWLVLRELAALLLAGVILGLFASFGCTRLVKAMLYGLTPNDPSTLAAAGTLLLAVAALAGYFPARSATRVDPLVALRDE